MTKLFGTDGIRGTVGEWPMVPEFFLKLGKAVGTVISSNIGGRTVFIGRDTRQSGQMLENALVAGLLEQDVNVISVGVIPTPGVAWLVRHNNAEIGVVISASHNPVDQNGIKFFNNRGLKMPLELELEIEELVLSESPLRSKGKHNGRFIQAEAMQEAYVQSLVFEHGNYFLDGLTIVVDCSNGAASQIAPDVFSRSGAKVVALHASPTGLNINLSCGSERVRRNPSEMGNIIRYYQADLGLAFDGDADRVVFVDQDGVLIDGDHMLGFLSRYLDQRDLLLSRSVVTTTMRNQGLKQFVENSDLNMYETPVGDKYVVEKIMSLWHENQDEGKIGLGGEQSGHIILFDGEHHTGDGIRTALFVLNAFLQSHSQSFADFAKGIGKTPQIIASAYVGSGDRITKKELKEIEHETLKSQPGLLRANLRYSGTEPLFRIMLESDNTYSENDLGTIALEISKKAQQVSGQPNGSIDILNCTRGGVLSPKKLKSN